MVSSEVLQPHVVLELHVQFEGKSVVLELFVIELLELGAGAFVTEGLLLALRFPPEVVVVAAWKK